MRSINSLFRRLGFEIHRADDSRRDFHSYHYLRHNSRRLEHLASLRIPVANLTVLEVGAGIGDHSHYYLDRNCTVTITEARRQNLSILKQRYPGCDVQFLDMEAPVAPEGAPFDVVHCYGLLYHLSAPLKAMEFLAQCTKQMLFLETCVSFGSGEDIFNVAEMKSSPTQAVSGTGCRPTRALLYRHLSTLFEYVYVPTTQPNHEEFPLDWTVRSPDGGGLLTRAVFVASRTELGIDGLVRELLEHQTRHP